jgi:hypothetical protein
MFATAGILDAVFMSGSIFPTKTSVACTTPSSQNHITDAWPLTHTHTHHLALHHTKITDTSHSNHGDARARAGYMQARTPLSRLPHQCSPWFFSRSSRPSSMNSNDGKIVIQLAKNIENIVGSYAGLCEIVNSYPKIWLAPPFSFPVLTLINPYTSHDGREELGWRGGRLSHHKYTHNIHVATGNNNCYCQLWAVVGCEQAEGVLGAP